MFRSPTFSLLLLTFATLSAQLQAAPAKPAAPAKAPAAALPGESQIKGDFETSTPDYNPWAGVDLAGNIHVFAGSQFAVSDTGAVSSQAFSPSVSIADLNGDGLPDLVVADARGYFWFFPNSGKKDASAFTHGEVMPIWIGIGWPEFDVVPRLQTVDITGDGKYSIVTGNYFGGLYYIRNNGSKSSPNFKMISKDRADYQFPTRVVKGKDQLWCNYLAPFLYDWSGQNRLDLTMGDGSYSANSIYLFKNLANNDRPKFNQDNMLKIIPGMGREHLTPQVIDWNNDGKPDIISGERTGYINVYLNECANKGDTPVFNKDTPIHVKFGSVEKIGTFTTVCPADLNGDGLFDIATGNATGQIMYSLNTGTPGNPVFGALVNFKGTNQYPSVLKPKGWALDRYRTDGAAYELVEVTNATVQPDFKPPEGSAHLGALKFSMVKHNSVYFPETFIPPSSKHWILYSGGVRLDTDTRYVLSFWARADGDISQLCYRLEGTQALVGAQEWEERQYTGPSMNGTGATWTRVTCDIRIPKVIKDNPKNLKEVGGFHFWLTFDGTGNFYFDDVTLKKAD